MGRAAQEGAKGKINGNEEIKAPYIVVCRDDRHRKLIERQGFRFWNPNEENFGSSAPGTERSVERGLRDLEDERARERLIEAKFHEETYEEEDQ